MELYSQHQQGCESVCYLTTNQLRDSMNEVMKAWYQNLIDCAGTEAQLSITEADSAIVAANNQKKATLMQAYGQMVSGGLGILMAGGDLGVQFYKSYQMKAPEAAMANITEMEKQLKAQPAFTATSGTQEPSVVRNRQEQEHLMEAIRDFDYTKGTFDFSKTKKQLTQAEQDFGILEKEDIKKVCDHLEISHREFKTRYDSLNQDIQKYTSLLQIISTVTNTIDGGFKYAQSNYQFNEALYNALKTTASENRQVETNGIDAITMDGIKNATQTIDAFLQAIQTMTSADVRA